MFRLFKGFVALLGVLGAAVFAILWLFATMPQAQWSILLLGAGIAIAVLALLAVRLDGVLWFAAGRRTARRRRR